MGNLTRARTSGQRECGMAYKLKSSRSRNPHTSRERHASLRRPGKLATGQCALRGARDVPAGERDNWSDVVNPAPYLDPKGRGNNSMVRKGR